MPNKFLPAALAALVLAGNAMAAQWQMLAGAPLAPALQAPRGVAVARNDTIYFTDGHALRALRPDGSLLTVAGDPRGAGYADGPGAQARFKSPSGVAIGADGTLYVADTGNHVIRSVSTAGVVGTVAGLAGSAGKTDGKPGEARFHAPAGITIDKAGDLYVADWRNGALRRIAREGSVSTLAVRLPFQPQGVALDAQGRLVVNDMRRAVKLEPDGKLVKLEAPPAAAAPEAPDNCRRARCLRRYQPVSLPLAERSGAAPAVNVAADRHGNLVVASTATATLYRIDADGVIVPLAGQGDIGGAYSGAAMDALGRLHVLLEQPAMAARWDLEGKAQPYALRYHTSLNHDGPAAQARFNDIARLAAGRDGNLYVLDGDQLRRVDKKGVVQTLREEGGFGVLREWRAAQADLRGSLAARASTGVWLTANGGLAGVSAEGDVTFVSGPPGQRPDETGPLAALRRIWAYVMQDAEPFVLPGLGQHRIAGDASGQAWYCADNVLWRIRPRGAARQIVLQGEDGCGDVLVAPNDQVFLLHGHYLTRVGGDGYQTLAAGHRTHKGAQDGAGLQARFTQVSAAAFDADSNLWLVDDGVVRKMSPDGEVSTEIGNAGGRHGRLLDLPAAAGKLRAIALDRKGTLYLATQRNILTVSK